MGALSGIKVADFSRVLAGPYATMMLADMGATVTKIERKGVGDDTRHWAPPVTDSGISTYFASVNRNKNTVALDLRDPDDLATARDLIAEADVVTENFRPGTMDKLGLGFDAARELNPAVVYASLSGFGSGPGRDLGGYDLVVQAMGGLMSITGPSPDEPTKAGVALIDVLTGLHLGMGILAALHHRDANPDSGGRGQHIEINLLSTALSSLVNQASAYLNAGVIGVAQGNKHPSIAPYEVFRTADGSIAIAAGNDSLYQALCRCMDREDLATEPRFATNSSRVMHRLDLVAELEHTLGTKTSKEWFALLREAGVPAGPVNNMADAFAFAETEGLAPIVDIDGEKSVRNPISFSETPVEYRTPPQPLPGAEG